MLISEEYRQLNKQLHETNIGYGTSGHKYSKTVESIAKAWGCETILDYGCGQGTLKRSLTFFDVAEYDPAIPGKDAAPEPADLVVCNDVLEHIESECIDDVLMDLARCTNVIGFLVVDIFPAVKILPDGRNAHILLASEEWWRRKIGSHLHVWTVHIEGIRKLIFIVRRYDT